MIDFDIGLRDWEGNYYNKEYQRNLLLLSMTTLYYS